MSADGHVHGASDLGIGASVNKAADFSFAPSKTQWTVGANGRRDTNQHQIVESDFVLLPRSALSDFKDQTRERYVAKQMSKAPRLSDEFIASISLLLPLFDKQFEHSLSI
jgi:hypothetical protein